MLFDFVKLLGQSSGFTVVPKKRFEDVEFSTEKNSSK